MSHNNICFADTKTTDKLVIVKTEKSIIGACEFYVIAIKPPLLAVTCIYA